MSACEVSVERARIDDHFAARISATEEQQLRAHLTACQECRAYYERHLVLAAIDPKALPAQQRIGLALGLSPRRASSRWPVYAGVAFAVTALAVLLIAPNQDRDAAGEFTARGAALKTEPAEIIVYRVRRGSAPERVTSKIRRGDELMFAYRNDKGFRYLLVFGVDEAKRVYWYYPGWSDPNTTPEAISIRPGPKLVELPDAVSHELEARKLRLFAIFSDTPRSVRELEERVKSLDSARQGPLFPGTFELDLPLEVE